MSFGLGADFTSIGENINKSFERLHFSLQARRYDSVRDHQLVLGGGDLLTHPLQEQAQAGVPLLGQVRQLLLLGQPGRPRLHRRVLGVVGERRDH